MRSAICEIWSNRADYMGRVQEGLEFAQNRNTTLMKEAAKVAEWQEFGLPNRDPQLMLRALYEMVSYRCRQGSYLATTLLLVVENSDEEGAKVQKELECLLIQEALIKEALAIERRGEIDPNRPRAFENDEKKRLNELVAARERDVKQAAAQAQQAALRAQLALEAAATLRIKNAQGVEQTNATLVAALVGTLAAQFFAAPIVATLTCAAIAATVVYTGYKFGYMPYYGEVASSS